MQLFYTPSLTPESQSFVFDKKESAHIVKVLRKSAGETLQVTNGKGNLFTAQITTANPNRCAVEMVACQTLPPLPYTLHMAVAPTKRNERMEWFLEKATEIGITEITPLICARSERKKINLKRYQRILQSAMKQSLQVYLPKLNEPVDYALFLAQNSGEQKFIAHCEDTQKKPFKDAIQPELPLVILIGPEGDFSPEEIEAALQHQYRPVSLGAHRLRTETAALAACHTVSLFLG